MSNKGMMEFGSVPQKASTPKKEQTVLVNIPPEMKKALNSFAILNTLVWCAAGIVSLKSEALPVWGIVMLSIAIFCCTVIFPVFIAFINKIPWGQRGG